MSLIFLYWLELKIIGNDVKVNSFCEEKIKQGSYAKINSKILTRPNGAGNLIGAWKWRQINKNIQRTEQFKQFQYLPIWGT